VTNILHIIIPLQFELICKEFECPRLAKFAKKIFNRYKETFIKALPENRREDVHFDNPSYAAASFLLTAEYMKVKIDKKKLLEITDCRSKDFEQSYESINELIFIPLKAADNKAKLKTEQASKPSKALEDVKPVRIEKTQIKEEINEIKITNRVEDFRPKVNDILNIDQTDEDIKNIQTLMIDIDDTDDSKTKKSIQEKNLEINDYVNQVLEERKAQRELAKQAAPKTKKQITLDFFVKKNDRPLSNEFFNLTSEDDLHADELVENDLKDIPNILNSEKDEQEKKQKPAHLKLKRKSSDSEISKTNKKSKKSIS